MTTLTLERPVKRNDVTVKIDAKAAETAKKAASLKGMTLAEYLSLVVGPIAERDLKAEADKISGVSRPPKR